MAKVIVITGAGMGLGRATARRLAADGNTLVLLGRTLSKVEKVADELGHGAFGVACDVSSADSVRAAFASIAERHAKIDVLINNAAIYQPFLVTEATDEQIAASLATNMAGPVYCCRAAIPMMGRGAHIINISSESAIMPFAMLSMYQSTKAGLERFSESLHAELMPDGIRVTMTRCGQMKDDDSTWDIDPAVAGRFVQSNMERGLNLRGRPISEFTSVAEVLRTLVNLPADVNIPHLTIEGWRS